MPSALRSPIALITLAVVAVAAIGLVFVLVQNAVGGSRTGTIVAPSPFPAALAHGRSLGSANAPLKLDEWEDFQCPYCDNYSVNIEPHLISQYVSSGQLEITYHDYSFIGQESFTAAVAARCAGDQGQFWAFMEYLFANQGTENSGTFNQALYDGIAGRLSLDQARFNQCLSDPSMLSAVQAETDQGKQLGITGTPTLFLNGKQYTGGLDLPSVSAAIDAALRALPSAPPSAAAGASPATAGSPAASSAGAARSPAPTPGAS